MDSYISFDIETLPTRPGLLVPRLVCSSLSDGQYKKLLNKKDTLSAIKDILKSNVNLVGHRICYDLAVVANECPQLLYDIFKAYENGRIYDVNVNQQLIDIATGEFEFFVYQNKKYHNNQSLQQYCLRYLNENISKGVNSFQLRFGELEGLPVEEYPQAAKDYALGDAIKTWQINEKQLELAGAEIPTRILQTCASFALHLMAIRGVRTNPQKVFKFRDRVKAEYDSAKKRLMELGYIKKDGVRDTKLIRKKVEEAYERLGVNPPMTDGGKKAQPQISIDRDALLATKDADLVLISKLVGYEKDLNTFIPLLVNATEVPFNPGWNVLVTSGRTSCGNADNVGNLQNQKRDGEGRPCFEPRKDFYYCSTDYNTAELRSLSEVCLDFFNFSVMADEFKEGRDPHLSFAADLLEISYEKALENKRDKDVKNSRQFGKIFNFGAPGGQKPPSLVEYAKGYGVELTLDKAEFLYNKWINHYTEMYQYFQYNKSLIGGGWGTKIAYKHHKSGFVRADLMYTELLNHHFQHLTACYSKEALVRVTKECYTGESYDGKYTLQNKSPLYGSYPVLFEHDELITEVKKDKAHEAAFRQAEVMIQAADIYIKKVPNLCEPALMTSWYKNAEAVYDKEGKLIPWEP